MLASVAGYERDTTTKEDSSIVARTGSTPLVGVVKRRAELGVDASLENLSGAKMRERRPPPHR